MLGRATAFNLTLFFTAIFGMLASFANTFPLLCLTHFVLGTAVGVRSFLRLVSASTARVVEY